MVTLPPLWALFNIWSYFREEILPYAQPKPFLAQPVTVPLCPITCLRKKASLHLTTTSLQGAVERDEVSSEPTPLQTKQSPLPQLLPKFLAIG